MTMKISPFKESKNAMWHTSKPVKIPIVPSENLVAYTNFSLGSR